MTATRTVIYGRQSQSSDASIEQQIDAGRERAEREGWAVAGTYRDGVSASRHTNRTRDDWPKLVAAVEAGQVDMIWLWESSRGDRELETWARLLRVTREHGTLFCIETHGGRTYDMAVPREWRTLAEDGVDSEYESDKIKLRVNRAKDSARREGVLRKILGGSPPVGYQNGARDWEPEPVAARMLTDMAERVLAGEHLAAAFREQPAVLDARGELITEKMVRAALQRPATFGMVTARDGAILGPAKYIPAPPVDPALRTRLLASFDDRRRPGPVASYPLGPVLRCGKCGNQLTGTKSKGTPYYRCGNPHKGLQMSPCRGVSVPAADIELVIRTAVETWAATSAKFAAASGEQAGLTAEAATLTAQRRQAQASLAGLEAKTGLGIIPLDLFAEHEAVLLPFIAQLSRQIDELAEQAANPLPAVIDWDGMTGPERCRIVRSALVTPIAVAPGNGGGAARSAAERVSLTVQA